MSTKTVLVAGATGRLGGLVDVLLARGHSVRAMTRDPGSAAGSALGARGAMPVYGDFEDPAAIARAAVGTDTLFATGTAHRAGPEGELRHGRNVVDAAVAAGVPHLVYSSGDGAAPDSPLPLFQAKFAIEEHIRASGLRRTILAPVYLMENLFNPWNLPALRAGTLPSPIPVGRPLQQAAIADVVAFAALAIERPAEVDGERIAIASDELSAREAAARVSAAIGRELEAERLPPAGLTPPLRALFGWLERIGHHVDIDALRARYPQVGWRDYGEWAESQRERFRELCSHPSQVAG
jgi:uncharacterized protein YbjT (DUF2867 family)